MSKVKRLDDSSPKRDIDWDKYGLDSEQQRQGLDTSTDTTNLMAGIRQNDLFLESQVKLIISFFFFNYILIEKKLKGELRKALVEIKFFLIATDSIWNLGWSLHLLFNPFVWCNHFFEGRLGCCE